MNKLAFNNDKKYDEYIGSLYDKYYNKYLSHNKYSDRGWNNCVNKMLETVEEQVEAIFYDDFDIECKLTNEDGGDCEFELFIHLPWKKKYQYFSSSDKVELLEKYGIKLGCTDMEDVLEISRHTIRLFADFSVYPMHGKEWFVFVRKYILAMIWEEIIQIRSDMSVKGFSKYCGYRNGLHIQQKTDIYLAHSYYSFIDYSAFKSKTFEPLSKYHKMWIVYDKKEKIDSCFR